MGFVEYVGRNRLFLLENTIKLTKNDLIISNNLKEKIKDEYLTISYDPDEKIIRIKINEHGKSLRLRARRIHGLQDLKNFSELKIQGYLKPNGLKEIVLYISG